MISFKNFIAYILAIIIAMIGSGFVFSSIVSSRQEMYQKGKTVGYKQGQIDALNGKTKYILVTQENGEKIWEEKDLDDEE